MKNCDRFRSCRDDLSEYLIHFTKAKFGPYQGPRKRLLEILKTGYIRPTFAPCRPLISRIERPTIKGPYPAICLTEQPLTAIVQSNAIDERYSGYGIAYHRILMYERGARQVIYDHED